MVARAHHSRTLALLSAGLALWAGFSAGWPGPRWRLWEHNLENQLLLWRGPRRPPPQVLLVTVDDASLQQASWFSESGPGAVIPPWARNLHTLPWPRSTYGLISERLLQAGAAAVAINVVFDGVSSHGRADDTTMTALLRRVRGRLALAAEMLEPEDSRGAGGLTLVEPPEPFLEALGGPGAIGLTNGLPPLPGRPLPHPEAYSGGLLRDQGVSAPPALSTTLLRLAGRRSLQDDARQGLNVYGPEGTLPRLPAWEVLDPQRWQSHPLRSSISGAVVVVGPLTGDRLPTTYGPLSGLELLATATANSLQGDGLSAWPAAAPARALLALAVSMLAALLALHRRALAWRLGVLAAVLILQVVAALLALQVNRWIPLMAPASALVLMGLLYGGQAYVLEGRERRRLRHTFERYVAPSVVAEILDDPESARGILRGRVLEVTVLFSDLQGFTQLTRRRSEAGQSELHVRQLNTYLGAMVEVITAHGGTVDKFIGDAVMAVFGSPVGRGPAQEAQTAVRCALAMAERLEHLNAEWRRQSQVDPCEPLSSGVGLASGPVMAGQIGSPQRMEFTVIGDTVNRASRMEGLTRQLGVSLCLDGATAALVDGSEAIRVHSLGLQPVKGLGEIEVFAAGPPR